MSLGITSVTVICLILSLVFVVNENDSIFKITSFYALRKLMTNYLALGCLYSNVALIGYNIFKMKCDISRLRNKDLTRYRFSAFKKSFIIIHGIAVIIITFLTLALWLMLLVLMSDGSVAGVILFYVGFFAIMWSCINVIFRIRLALKNKRQTDVLENS